MNEFRHIMVIELKFLQAEKMFNIFRSPVMRVIHPHYVETFPDEPVTQM